MNRQPIAPYYRLLEPLKKHGELSGGALAEILNLSPVTVQDYCRHLRKQEFIVRAGPRKEIIRITRLGFNWEPAEVAVDTPAQAENVKLWPCGHPVAASTPGFCLECRRERNREEYKLNGMRYYPATLSQVLER